MPFRIPFVHVYRPGHLKHRDELPTSRPTLSILNRDVHLGPAPRAATATAAPATARRPQTAQLPPESPEPIFRNRELETVKSDGRKSYRIEGLPVLPSYLQTTQKADNAASVGQGTAFRVSERHNPEAAVLIKRGLHPRDAPDALDLQYRLNDIAWTLARSGDADMKGHFAVEVFKELKADGTPVLYTPKVTGFSLDRYFADPQAFRDELSPEQLVEESARLDKAIEWLHGQGFAHNDVQPSNIMFDTVNRKLVLIDFERASDSRGLADLQYDLTLLDEGITEEARALAGSGQASASTHAAA